MIDLFRRHILALSLACLHEIDVVLQQRCVEHGFNAILVTYVGHGKHIFKRYGLTADKVSAGLYSYERHLLRTVFLDSCLQFIEVEISFERIIALRQQTLAVDYLYHLSPKPRDVGFGSGEMEVHDSHHAGFHICLREDILTGAPLMCREHIVRTEHLFHSFLHPVESLASGI